MPQEEMPGDKTDMQTDIVPEQQPPRCWIPTLFTPYCPGLSERLRNLSAKSGVRNWYAYSGKTKEKVSNFKDKLHQSKNQNTIYTIACKCGVRYIGESIRNLKIRVHEHKLKSSKSALSLHVREFEDPNIDAEDADHSVVKKSTLVLGEEKNTCKRKFVESVCIVAKAPRVCNLGPSVQVSEIWNTNLAAVAHALPNFD